MASTKIQVVFYSMYGHIHQMAESVAEGARQVKGVEVDLYQVPELVPESILAKSGADKAREKFANVPVIEAQQLAQADAIIFGTPTRFGNMCAQMRNFLDQTGGLWVKNKLVGKVGSVFASTGTQHGGQETPHHQFSFHPYAPWHGDCRSALLRSPNDHDGRNIRRHPLRRNDSGGRRRQAPAIKK